MESKRCRKCGVFLAGAATVFCALCMPADAHQATQYHGPQVTAARLEAAELPHLPEQEFSTIARSAEQAAFPPAARVAAPFRQQMPRPRSAVPRRGYARGQYVVTNPDGTTRLVRVGF